MKISREASYEVIECAQYRVTIMPDRLLALVRKGPRFYYGIQLISAVDAIEGLDMARHAPLVRPLSRKGKAVCLDVVVDSTIWKKKTHHFVFKDDRIEFHTVVEGKGKVDRAYYFRGILNDRELGSVGGFTQFFSPQSNFIEKQDFHSGEFTSIAAGEDERINKSVRHFGLFGAPLCYVFHEGDTGPFLSAGILAKPGQYLFHAFEINHWPDERRSKVEWPVVGSQAFSLAYHGHQRVDGKWQTPTMLLQFSKGRFEAIEQYVGELRAFGGMFRRKRRYEPWTFKPIYCTWHDQCAMSIWSDACETDAAKPPRPSACDVLTQEQCERWLEMLEEKRLLPGSYIIDAKWQVHWGDNVVDTAKFPDLRGFVDRCHGKGVKVILHTSLWNVDGLPAEECMSLDGKKTSAPDPTHPKYQKRVEEIVRRLLSGAKGCYNADGMKMDSPWYPGGRTLKTHSGLAGFELARLHQELFSRAAQKVKPDSVMGLCTAFPYLADLCDFARTGDLYSPRGCPIWTNEFRARMINIVMPGVAVDTDGELEFNAVLPDEEVLAGQAATGVPCLYQIEKRARIRDFTLPQVQALDETDYGKFRKSWNAYEKRRRD